MQTILTIPNKPTNKQTKNPKQSSSTSSKETIGGKMIKK